MSTIPSPSTPTKPLEVDPGFGGWHKTVGSFLSVKYPVTQWVIPKLIPGVGWTYLVSQAKVGKSMFAAQLAEAISLGLPFLGFDSPTKKWKVAYIQADEPAPEWQAQMAQMQLNPFAPILMAEDPEIYFLHSAEARKRVRDALTDNGIEYVIFDSQYSLFHKNLYDPEEVANFRNSLRDVWKGPFMLLHHPRKPPTTGQTENFIDGSAGSFALTANASAILGLRPDRLIMAGGRLLKKGEYPMHRDEETGRWVWGPGFSPTLPADMWTGQAPGT